MTQYAKKTLKLWSVADPSHKFDLETENPRFDPEFQAYGLRSSGEWTGVLVAYNRDNSEVVITARTGREPHDFEIQMTYTDPIETTEGVN